MDWIKFKVNTQIEDNKSINADLVKLSDEDAGNSVTYVKEIIELF
ncbi:hypothetical protein TrispH2_010211 [Trichoplax sp. H2]|nr:hypothetical protein TrispH2_010211 [Trichoplax sp. H2]|eukprot:RDD37928.1 hypothetical protein TrispH2_010211 [Trichoplax sp. H2]